MPIPSCGPGVFGRHWAIVMGGKPIAGQGRVRREGQGPNQAIHAIADRLYDLTFLLRRLRERQLLEGRT